MIDLLIIGITLGAIYALMALGLNLVFGVTKVFNYAQGAFFTWGTYLCWFLSAGSFHLNYALAIILTIPIMFLFGFGFERVIIHPLRRLPEWTFIALIVTLGSALFLDNLALLFFGGRHKTLPRLLEGSFDLGGHLIGKHDVLVLLATIAIVIIMGLFLGKTRTGMSLRAVTQDVVGAQIAGIPIDRMYGLAFGLAAVLGTISGILLVPRTLIYPYVGWVVFIKAFVIMIFGGLGSFKGTLVAAFILGVVEAITTFYIGSVWGVPFFLVILIIVLVFRPRGLFGIWA